MTVKSPRSRRFRYLGLAALVLLAVAAIAVAMIPRLTRPTAGTVTLRWDPADSGRSQDESLLQASELIARIPPVLQQRLQLPQNLTIAFVAGDASAAFDPGAATLRFPYGFVATIRGGLKVAHPESTATELDQRVQQAAGGVLLHEIGHVLVHDYQLPVLGGEEVVADTFAAASIRLVGDDLAGDLPAAVLSYADFLAGVGDQQGTRVDLFDDHLPASVRADRLRCLVYGNNPGDVAASTVPPYVDQPYCAADFAEAHESWVSVLSRYQAG